MGFFYKPFIFGLPLFALWFHMRYHFNMSKKHKIIEKMRNNPLNWKIEDFKVIANRLKIEYQQLGTSHVTFRAKNSDKVTVPAHKPIKPIYVKLFLAFIDKLGENNE